MAGCGAYRIG